MDKVTRGILERIVGHVSQTAVKHWLRVNEYAHTAGNTSEFYDLLIKLVNEGKLSIDGLSKGALEIEENGGKRIYLKKLNSINNLLDKGVLRAHLKDIHLDLSDSPTASIKIPPQPTVNYIYYSEQELRIKVTETHTNLDIDLEKQKFLENKVTKFSLAILDYDSKILQIRLDAPGDIHSHKDAAGNSNEQVYEAYYFNLFMSILGIGDLPNLDLSGVAEHIVNIVPRVFRLPVELVRTGANSRQRYSCRGDVRDDPARQAAAVADSMNWVYEDLSGYWIADQSNGMLQRDVFMQLKRKPSMIRFLADCLTSEVDYALSRVRNL